MADPQNEAPQGAHDDEQNEDVNTAWFDAEQVFPGLTMLTDEELMGVLKGTKLANTVDKKKLKNMVFVGFQVSLVFVKPITACSVFTSVIAIRNQFSFAALSFTLRTFQ